MKGPIAQGTIRTTFVLGLRLLVQAGTLLLVARMLGPHEFGAFAGVAALAVTLGTLSTFGTQLILASEVSKEPTRRTQVLGYAIPTTLGCGSLLLVAYLLLCVFVLRETGISVTVLLAIGIAELLLQPLFELMAWEHIARGRVARSQLLRVFPLALRLVAAALVFALQRRDPLTLYGYGYLAASLAALSIAMATTTQASSWPPPRLWRLARKHELQNAAGYALLALTNMGSVELDKTLASKLLPLSASGLYAVGSRIMGAAMLPVLAMMLSALPRIFRNGDDTSWRNRRLLRWVFIAALSYSIALATALWVTAPVFTWLFGTKYEGLEHVIRLLCLVLPGLALRKTSGNVLMGMGSPWARVQFEVVGLLTLLGVSIWLAPRYGITGMVIALASSEWAMTIVGCAGVFFSVRKRMQPQ